MDYKKKYREAQKWIESIYSELSHEQQMEAEAFFPELKESKDEKMMHQLHSWMKEFGGAEEYTEKVYTWLKSLIEKQGEQEPTDKVEPKFHEGEWITNGDYTWKIVEVKPLDYILQSQEGNIVDDTISHVDEQFHSFTIKDAKDGDVLASNRSIFIFSQEYIAGKPEAHCGIMNGLFLAKPEGCWTNEKCYPATKEQRDTLFAKMKEAGYEWNTEKKELKKISQRMVSAEAKEALYDKPAWSEEDERKITDVIVALSEYANGNIPNILPSMLLEDVDWLKSLKPQNHWKPAKEQMEALHDLNLTGNISYAGQGQVLIELYNDLKKL